LLEPLLAVFEDMPDNRYRLTSDPAYYGTAAVFALLTTALPAASGQSRFLPIAQAIALTAFLAIPIRKGLWKEAVKVLGIWIALALAVVIGLTVVAADHMERSISNGFEYRASLLTWVYGASAMPDTMRTEPARKLLEMIGILAGTVLTAGLFGNWLLMQAVNLTGFGIAIVWGAAGGPSGLLLAIPIWSLLHIAGIAGLVILLSEPLLSGHWSPRYYWMNRRALVVGSVALAAMGLLLGFVAPPIWQSFMTVQVQ
jgi:hypothetical protein